MNMKELVLKNRTYRKFDQSVKISMSELEELVELARISSCGHNRNGLRYILVTDEERCKVICENLKWAFFLPDWPGPEEGERPVAYIVCLRDESAYKGNAMWMWDLGIALENMTLGAVEKGYGGCQFASLNYQYLEEYLDIEKPFKLASVLTLGKPAQEVQLVDLVNGQTPYYQDEAGVHYVPKLKPAEIVYKKL
mgnify:CR=1 FL=1|jgi:nitroreductase